MSHTPHELAEEFPEFVELMGSLRQSDAHFAKMAEDYHVMNRTLHRAETNVEPVGDMYMIEMRKDRMALKDEIYAYLKAQVTPA